MKNFKLWNVLCGWLVFAVAAATYLLTMEPTASFWDCGEFISSAWKLDVGHPPGAPFFMLMGHFFSLFASDTSHVAMCVNALSALASAFTILFLFWTITALAKKLVQPDTMGKGIALLGAGAVGALAYRRRSRRSTRVHLLRYLLVLGGRRRGICFLIALHGCRLLAHSQMG